MKRRASANGCARSVCRAIPDVATPGGDEEFDDFDDADDMQISTDDAIDESCRAKMAEWIFHGE